MPVDDNPNFDLQHPYYQERREAWQYNLDHFKGGRTLSEHGDEYMARFALEEESSYNARLKRAMGLYDNLVRRALNVWQAQLFRVDPARKVNSKIDEKVLDDIDLYGTDANSFFERVGERAQLFEMSHVIVNSPKLPVDREGRARQISEAERQEQNLRPWFERIDPLALIDWAVEVEDPSRRGELNYAVVKDPKMLRQKKPFEDPIEVQRYRLYDRQAVTVYEVWDEVIQGKQTQQVRSQRIEHGMGEVPIVTFYDEFVAPMKGTTMMDDVAMSANALWQKASVADESYWYQGFNMLVLKTQEDLKELKIGEKRAIRLEPGEDASYLAPSSVPAEIFEAEAKRIVDRVADLVFARTGRQLPTGQVESAEKREIDRQEFVALLERKAQSLERSELRCWKLYARAWGLSPSDQDNQEVAYNRKFKVDEREADEWKKLTNEGIMSKAEWYMAEHPAVDDEEEAWKAIKENLKKNEEVKPANPMDALMRAAVTGAVGDGEDTNKPPGQQRNLPPAPGEEEDADKGPGDSSSTGADAEAA